MAPIPEICLRFTKQIMAPIPEICLRFRQINQKYWIIAAQEEIREWERECNV